MGVLRTSLVLLLLLTVAAARERDFTVVDEDVSVEGIVEGNVTRQNGKRVLGACRSAFVSFANRYALNTERVFFRGKKRPFWMVPSVGKEPRIRAVLEVKPRSRDTGAEAYMERMKRGLLRIHLAAPEGDRLSPDDLHRIGREMAYAIVCQTNWRGLPPWLLEGIAECLGEEGAGGAHSLAASFKEELRESRDDLTVGEVLTAGDRSAWGRLGGRAVSWALVRMLTEADPRIVPSLYNQCRLLVAHLVLVPDATKVGVEFTRIVHDQLVASGLTERKLTAALETWIDAGFPTGSDFRRSAARELLTDALLPRVYGVGIEGRFGPRKHVPDENGVIHHLQIFYGATIVWRLPFESRMEAWYGTRGRPGTNSALRPDTQADGYILDSGKWTAKKVGKHRLLQEEMEVPRQFTRIGFVRVGVLSPNGLGYVFEEEYQLR